MASVTGFIYNRLYFSLPPSLPLCFLEPKQNMDRFQYIYTKHKLYILNQYFCWLYRSPVISLLVVSFTPIRIENLVPSHPPPSQNRFHFRDKRTYLFHLKITDTEHKYLKLSSIEQYMYLYLSVCIACSENKAIFAGAISVTTTTTTIVVVVLFFSFLFTSNLSILTRR